VKDDNITRQQLEDELVKLRQENIELRLAMKDQERIAADSAGSSPSRWFSTGGKEMFVSHPSEQQEANPPIKYKFSDLVEIPFIQLLLNSFYGATGISHSLLDNDNNILSRAGWQEICTQFHRVCPQTECRCKQSDSYIAAHLHDGPYVGYNCMNGLIDYAAPIIIEGQHLATIFKGQFLHEPPDEDFFRRQAQEYGFDEAAYMEALHQVPIIPEEQIEAIMEFYSQLGQFLATMGLERKRQLEAADQTIREQQERLNLVWETSNDGFWDWNIARDELYLSPRSGEILGYSQEELEPAFYIWQKLLHPDDIDPTMKAVREYLKGRTATYEAEYRMLAKSGKWIWIMARGQVVARNDKGQPLRMAGINLDITERKHTEIAALKSKAQLQTIIENIPFYVWLYDNEGKFVAVNNSYCQACGFSADDIIGKTVFDIFPRDEAERYWVEDTEVIESQQPIIGEDLILSGEVWAEKFKIPVFDANQKTIGMVGLLRDITEQKHFQREVERLDRLNLVGEMAASIGHEIRNPMTTVRGYLQIMRENKEYVQEIEYFDLMIEELDRANSIITEFLSLAKNKMVDMTPRNLNTIISKSLPLIQAAALSRDQNIKLEMTELPDLLLDQKEIRQLILNLVNNGMEAMSSAGAVTIKTILENEDVVLAVQDQGHGIERELLDKLGTPFFTTKDQGTGLGLAVCYRIASRHNAKIDIETSSTGTTFYIRFPIPIVAAVS